jgi:HAE1 family hydrophobic/amphiphilic exporter-1
MGNGTAFMPEMESTQMTLTLEPEDGADLEEASGLSEEVISRISKIKDIETIGAMAGGGGIMSFGGGGGGTNISMYLLLREKQEKTNAQISSEIMKLTKDLNCEITVSSSEMDLSAMGGSGLSVRIKGRELEKLQEIAVDIAKLVKDTKGTTEVSDGLEETTPQFKIMVDKDKASKYGMTVAQVFQLVNEKIGEAQRTSTISTDIKDYEVFVAGEVKASITRKDIEKLKFEYTNKEGKKRNIALKKIVMFEEAEGLNSISRDAQERYISVSAAVKEGDNIGLVGSALQSKLDNYELPEGYSLDMTGENETINESMNQLMLMMLLAVIFVYLIMVAQFQSLLSPFIIMFTIPLAFTGGFLSLYFTGSELSVIAVIGFVMLAGVIVNNGIVMVDYTNQLRREGMSKKDALLDAGITRLRPVMMTALTTIIAMIPLAMGMGGGGADMMQPLALVMAGGMIYGTVLTLFVVPCIYDLFNRERSMVEEDF